MPEKHYTATICTLGCKVNQYESEAIAEKFEENGFTVLHDDSPTDVYVINTCTVTAESDRKARQLIRRALKQNKNAVVLVTGCFSQAAPEDVAKIKGVDYICGNTDKLGVVNAAIRILKNGKNDSPEMMVEDINSAPFEPMCIKHFDRTRAYVKIEDGCENHCTYCAIPAARGKVRSKPIAAVVAEVETLIAGGCREVVLTGIETASYGRDLAGVSLADLLEAVDRIKGDFRVRLGSLDPSLMKAAFVERIAKLTHLAPHFHLSVQSGSSKTLAAMKRKYNRDQALAGIERLRAALPTVELTADFIVGFPGENDADFAHTLDFVKQAEFLQIHVFAYSPRRGTPAADMKEQLDGATKKSRSAALIAAGEEARRLRLAKALESPRRIVLFESTDNGMAFGHTDSFLEVGVKASASLHNKFIGVCLTGIENEHLVAETEDCYEQ